MSSYKINIALVQNCPPLLQVKVALEALGRPSDRDYGVLAVHDIVEGKLDFGLFRSRHIKVQQVEKTDGSVTTPQIIKDDLHEAMLRQVNDEVTVLEVFTGSVASIDTVGEFLSALELADNNPQINTITHDIFAKLIQLRDATDTKLFAVQSAKLKGYKDPNDEKVSGTYSVKFGKDVPTENTMTFLQDHATEIESVKVKYRPEGLKKPVSITIRPSAFFTISCPEAAETQAKNICRKLAGVLVAPAFKPWAKIYEDVFWFVDYEVVQGKKQTTQLDAETLEDARTEAAGITELPEDRIQLD